MKIDSCLWLIWSEVLPALRFLDQVSMWRYTVTLDSETQRLPRSWKWPLHDHR